MSLPPPATLRHHLRRLDRDGLTEFLRACYSQRGYTVESERNVLIVSRDGHSRTVLVVPFRRLPRIGRSLPGRNVDVVATAGTGDGRAATLAAAFDAELLTGADLVGMLRYGVDPAAARRLCESAFGAPPAALRPPLRTRVRTRLDRLRTRLVSAGRRFRASMPTSPAGVEAAAVVVVVVLAATVASVGGGLLASPSENATLTTDAVTRTTDTPHLVADPPKAYEPNAGPTTPTAVSVPGLSHTGSVDVERLVESHKQTLETEPFRMHTLYRGPTAANGSSDGPYVLRQRDVIVDPVSFRVIEQATYGGVLVSATDKYYDGHTLYVARYESEDIVYDRIRTDNTPITPLAAAASTSDVKRYLATENVTTTGPVRRDDRVYYRVVATGPGFESDLGAAHNYTATALVSDRGLVTSLTAEYFVGQNATKHVYYRHTVRDVGTATASEPSWYDRNWSNESD